MRSVEVCLVLVLLGSSLWLLAGLGRSERSGNRSSNIVARSEPEPLSVGSVVSIRGVRFSEVDHTLVLVVSSSCPFCTASLPSYKKLGPFEEPNHRARIVFVAGEPADLAQAYLRRYGITASVISLPLVELRQVANATPTVLLVDNSGRLERLWVGQQDSEGVEGMRRALMR